MRTKRPLSSGGYRGVLFLYGIHSCFYRCSPRVVFCNIARIMIVYTPPIRAVISCVTENCSCRTCNIGCIFTGNIFGKIISEIRIPIKRAFNTAPITTDTGSPAFSPNFLRSRATARTRIAFPIIMHGNIAGMAAIIGLPVMKKDVIGVMTLKIMPHASPA